MIQQMIPAFLPAGPVNRPVVCDLVSGFPGSAELVLGIGAAVLIIVCVTVTILRRLKKKDPAPEETGLDHPAAGHQSPPGQGAQITGRENRKK